jgi:hypothetical protein
MAQEMAEYVIEMRLTRKLLAGTTTCFFLRRDVALPVPVQVRW